MMPLCDLVGEGRPFRGKLLRKTGLALHLNPLAEPSNLPLLGQREGFHASLSDLLGSDLLRST